MVGSLKNNREFEDIFKEHYPGLVVYANKYVGVKQVAEDIVQDFFYELWNKRESLIIQSNIKSFLFQSIRNQCLNYISREKKDHKELDSNAFEEQELSFQIEHIERNKMIYDILEKLPEQRKNIFKLCCIEGLKYKEVAEDLGISVNTVKTQMGRALSELRKSIDKVIIYFLGIFKK